MGPPSDLTIFDYKRDLSAAIKLLKRVNEGDDSVFKDIHPFLEVIRRRDEELAAARNAKETRRETRAKTGRKHSGLFEISPRYDKGSDFGAEGIVLARKGQLTLVWRYGSTYWASMFEPRVYAPGDLEVHGEGVNRSADYRNLTNNHRTPNTKDTRLTKALILRYADQINKVFDLAIADEIAKLKKTVIIDIDGQPQA